MTFSDLGGKIVAAVATACVLGGGTVVLSSSRVNAVQDIRLDSHDAQFTEVIQQLRTQTDRLHENNAKLERLLGRIDGK